MSSSGGIPSSTSSVIADPSNLVRALINFGHDEHASTGTEAGRGIHNGIDHDDGHEHDHDLDDENEEITVAGVKALSQHSKQKGKQREDEQEELDHELKNTHLDSDTVEAGQKSTQAVSKSIRSLLRSSQHTITLPPSTPGGQPTTRILTSWKMADYAYKRDPCPFPTRARGLFTERIDPSRDEYRIVARGYDKFFNVNEVSWTHWDSISRHSSAPYELTLKSNGCIILISALTPSHVLVTSKHSVGANAAATTDMSHSQRGEWWLDRHLEKIGKRKEDLANELWNRSLTAVAELCDDSFEEHVLAYPSHLTGLHLHGLNTNTPILHSLPSAQVTAFAKDWGLIPTLYTIFPSVLAVKTFCETVEAAGGMQEDDGSITPVEGFVVRGQKKGPGSVPGEPFFWKVKYDDPYLMYREWRELTRKLLAAYPDLDGVNPNKLKNEQSRLYLWWVKREIQNGYDKFDSWKKGKGIIKTREEFLRWRDSEEAKGVRKQLGEKVDNSASAEERKKKFDRTLVVPIAVPGCGKTVLGLEMSKLFGWAHTQSDDFHMKKSGPHFIRSVKDLLQTHEVVYADKNNHQKKLRSDLVDCARSLEPAHHTRLVALVYQIDTPEFPRDKLHALCAQRILERGQRHQTLRPARKDDPDVDEADLRAHEQAVWQFLGQYEKFDPALNAGDGLFDVVVEMRPEWTRREALERAIEALRDVVPGVEMPNEEKRQEVVEWASRYEPEKKKVVSKEVQEKKKAKVKPRYYGIKVEADLKSIVETAMRQRGVSGTEDGTWAALVAADRVEKNPHVTLVHENEVKEPGAEENGKMGHNELVRLRKKALWDRYADMVKRAEQVGHQSLEVTVTLGPRIAWDGRAMAIEVSAMESVGQKSSSTLAQIEMPTGLVDGAKGNSEEEERHAHVTVGTREEAIRPIEGKWLLSAVLKGEKMTGEGGNIHVIEMEQTVKVPGSLAGLR